MNDFAQTRVQVRQGTLQGRVENGQKVFRGIPYAAPPIGQNRWRDPQPPARWFGVRDVDRLVGGALQTDIRAGMPEQNFELGARMDSEDCLYLNIWTPATSPDDKLPVLVWVHGGGMVAGTGMAPFFEGEKLAEQGIIVVTINYRLGLFGFLCHPELTAESPHNSSGNYALMDIRQAVLWLRENLAAFGGDAERITVGGQSGGSVGTSCMLLSPLMDGLCQRVILESGCPMLRGMMNPKPLAEMEREGASFAESLSSEGIAGLRAMDGCDLFEASAKYGYTPNYCVDNYFLLDEPGALFQKGRFNDMEVLVGATSEEFGSLGPRAKQPLAPERFEAYVKDSYPQALHEALLQHYPHRDSRESLRALLRLQGDVHFLSPARMAASCATYGRSCYLYYKTRPDPGSRGELVGSTHSSELPYLFGRPEKCVINPEGMDAAEQSFGRQLQAYWVNFVKTGNPNGADTMVEWPACRQLFDYLDLGTEIHLPQAADKEILTMLNDMLVEQDSLDIGKYLSQSVYET